MSDSETEIQKGQQVKIARGPKDVGVTGEVFWIGPNKWGPGLRFGVKDADGATYWTNQEFIDALDGAAPPPAKKTASSAPQAGGAKTEALEKGAEVEIVSGKEGVGTVGHVFWTGKSRYGKGMRYGVRAGEDTYWVDQENVRATGNKQAPQARKGGGSAGAAPMPGDGDGGAFEGDFEDDFSDGFGDGFAADFSSAAGAGGEPPPFADDDGFASDDFAGGESAPFDDDEDIPF